MEIVIGNRIPMDYFITAGVGSSDNDRHAGSFHLALRDAGIENCNIIRYSSILPSIANKIDKRYPIIHGEVAECIIAEANGEIREQISAGIIYGWLYDENNNRYGGLVCERANNSSEIDLIKDLKTSLNELYVNGYSHFDIRDIEIQTKSMVGDKKYNTVIVALVFQTYKIELM